MSRPLGRTGKGERKTSRETFDLVRALVRKIGCQFPDNAEARMMLAIFAGALNDLITNRTGFEVEAARRQAAEYLAGSIWHAQICGVDPEWIRYQLKTAGIKFGPEVWA